MDYFIKYGVPLVLYIGIPVLILAAVYRWYVKRSIVYLFPYAHTYVKLRNRSNHLARYFFFWLRLTILFFLLLATAKPQLVDPKSVVHIDGIDIILALDVSGSMQFPNSNDDQRSRYIVAQQEAIHFIEKRPNDAIGLVLFGGEAITRCPLTADKKIVAEIINDTKLGDIDYTKTFLVSGIMTAINRLKYSQAKSKVIILLTDGTPSEGDMNLGPALEIAKKLGIKIYAIGIGSTGYVLNSLYCVDRVNEKLLQHIAHETGGQCFMAHNAHDMRAIYDTIDNLEKVHHETTVFSITFDLFLYHLALAIILLLCELGCATCIWYGLW